MGAQALVLRKIKGPLTMGNECWIGNSGGHKAAFWRRLMSVS